MAQCARLLALAALALFVPLPATAGAKAVSPTRLFAPTSIWNAPVRSDSRLDSRSRAFVGELVNLVRLDVAKRRGPWINTTSYSIPVVTVPARQRRRRVILDRPETFLQSLRDAFAAVPIPSHARPAAGTDKSLVVWQPSSDTLWEFWKAERRPDGWHARYGGRILRVSTSPGFYNGNDRYWGGSASSLSIAGGLITPEELRAGRINHALAIALPEIKGGQWSWPAQRADGNSSDPYSIPEGARFRLDPRLDIAALGLSRVGRILAEAAQRYGLIVRDRAACVTFYARDAGQHRRNPYPKLFDGRYPSALLARFPWNRLQMLALHLSTWRSR